MSLNLTHRSGGFVKDNISFDLRSRGKRGSISEMDADRTQDSITKAKREGFDSGAAWMLLGACWAFILGSGVWAVIGELDNVDTGIWKGPIVLAIMALAVLLWWLPLREARRRARP